MPHYLIEVGYTPESWRSQIESKAKILDRITPVVQACKGRIESIYYAFGDSDLVGILDFPSPEDAAAFALAVTSGGALRSFRTTPLLTVDQGMTALERAGEVRSTYAPPVTISLEEKAKAR